MWHADRSRIILGKGPYVIGARCFSSRASGWLPNLPEVQPAAVPGDNALSDVLIARTDRPTGRMLGTLLCGLLMQSVLREDLPSKADVEEIFRRAIAGTATNSVPAP
jgi:hypothetical protein